MLARRSSAPAAAALVTLAALASSGCLAASARLHGGAVAIGDRVGVQVGASFGIGLTRSRASAIVGNVGFATGDAPRAGLTDAIEYVRVPDSWAAAAGRAPCSASACRRAPASASSTTPTRRPRIRAATPSSPAPSTPPSSG